MPVMKGLLAPQNTFLDTIATRFDGTRKFSLTSYLGHFINHNPLLVQTIISSCFDEAGCSKPRIKIRLCFVILKKTTRNLTFSCVKDKHDKPDEQAYIFYLQQPSSTLFGFSLFCKHVLSSVQRACKIDIHNKCIFEWDKKRI